MVNEFARQTLETFVDHYTIDDVLTALADICEAKAEHVAATWQDMAMAKRWAKCSVHIDRAAAKCARTSPIPRRV